MSVLVMPHKCILTLFGFDESTDSTDIAQVAIFVRGINATFDITEELASLFSLKDTTTGENLFQVIMCHR